MTVFAVLLMASAVSAVLVDNDISIKVDGTSVTSNDTIGVIAGETLPIDVAYTAVRSNVKAQVEVSAWISGYRNDIQDSVKRLDIIDGSLYTEHLSLAIPSDLKAEEDEDSLDEGREYTLYVRFEAGNDYQEFHYTLRVQRNNFNVEVLSAEAPTSVTAGSNLPVNVVIKNRGMHELEDAYVTVKISELGISKNVYFGDVTPSDECDDDCEQRDAVEKTVNLAIPGNAKAGTYKLEVVAYNDDTSRSVSKNIIVAGAEEGSVVLTSMTGTTVKAGEESSFNVILVNSGDKVKVYNLVPEETANLRISVDESIAAVSAGSSKTVKITVTPVSKEGTYNFAVNVMSDNQLVKRLAYTVNVEGTTLNVANPIVILTVVLAIIFLVLLVVLIVLLTRKPEASQEETSYY